MQVWYQTIFIVLQILFPVLILFLGVKKSKISYMVFAVGLLLGAGSNASTDQEVVGKLQILAALVMGVGVVLLIKDLVIYLKSRKNA